MSPLEESRQQYAGGYYAEKLEQGLVFQDFVARQLYRLGIVIVGYSSRRYQNKYGENMLGAEIKRDGNFRETLNPYIEIAEKSHPDRSDYIDSGIMRDDNSWMFVIGDEGGVWIFSTVHLRRLVKSENWKQVEKPTSIGILMPVADANRHAIRIVKFQKEG